MLVALVALLLQSVPPSVPTPVVQQWSVLVTPPALIPVAPVPAQYSLLSPQMAPSALPQSQGTLLAALEERDPEQETHLRLQRAGTVFRLASQHSNV